MSCPERLPRTPSRVDRLPAACAMHPVIDQYRSRDHRRRPGLSGALLAAALVLGPVGGVCLAAPYEDDPAVTALLEGMGDRESLLLPPVRVQGTNLPIAGMERHGPGQRDYCNKMSYVASRQTALYAGGNHQSPHRMNDVWEYHLGSNTWHQLYAPDGGNAGRHKTAHFLTTGKLARDPLAVLSEKELEQVDAYRRWWSANVVFQDGHLATTRGGPIMPSHTWDGICFDDRAQKLIWGAGASSGGELRTHAFFSGTPLSELKELADPTYTPMWQFDAERRQWAHYRTHRPRAALRGMGGTLTYLPDLGKSIWYVAAQNVTPPAFEMWLFDAVADEWTELKPNGGKSIRTLATKDRVAPPSEQQAAYSPRHRKLVAVLGSDTFVYDVAANEWKKAVTDPRIHAHDAKSIFVYDSHADVFLLAYPPHGKGNALQLAAFSLATGTWELIRPSGPAIPRVQYGNYAGYYDIQRNMLVIHGRNSDRFWAYRHRN